MGLNFHIKNNNLKANGEGFVCDISDKYWKNYLIKLNKIDEISEIETLMISRKIHRFIVIKTIYVLEDYRNEGLGKEILTKIITTLAKTNSCFLLVADTTNSNKFNLIKWYENIGFEIPKSQKYAENPLMYYLL